MLFADMCLPVKSCFYLFTLGPDCISISQCDSSEQAPPYSHFINQDTVTCQDLNPDIFSGPPNVNLRDLQVSLKNFNNISSRKSFKKGT